MYRCSAAVSWLNKDEDGGVWFRPGSGTLTLTMTANLIDTLPYHTAVIIVTNEETGRVLCREPIKKGLDYSTLQNKHPPTTSQLRCVSFELATGAPMMITVCMMNERRGRISGSVCKITDSGIGVVWLARNSNQIVGED